MDTLLDKRLVRTLVASIIALVEWRNRARGLLLSELGVYICSGVDPVPAWRVAQGLRAWDSRLLWDTRRHVARRTGVLAIPVWRRDDHLQAQPLWLVVARRGQDQEPWYLLTTETVTTAEDAWRIVSAYAPLADRASVALWQE